VRVQLYPSFPAALYIPSFCALQHNISHICFSLATQHSAHVTDPAIFFSPHLSPLLCSLPFYSADNVQFEKDLMDIARTTLSSKLLNVEKDHFARYTIHYTAPYIKSK
jgi:hypothetical protein